MLIFLYLYFEFTVSPPPKIKNSSILLGLHTTFILYFSIPKILILSTICKTFLVVSLWEIDAKSSNSTSLIFSFLSHHLSVCKHTDIAQSVKEGKRLNFSANNSFYFLHHYSKWFTGWFVPSCILYCRTHFGHPVRSTNK